jgi:hypothetical protein
LAPERRRGFAALRPFDFGVVLGGLAAFGATRLVAAFFAAFADLMRKSVIENPITVSRATFLFIHEDICSLYELFSQTPWGLIAIKPTYGLPPSRAGIKPTTTKPLGA